MPWDRATLPRFAHSAAPRARGRCPRRGGVRDRLLRVPGEQPRVERHPGDAGPARNLDRTLRPRPVPDVRGCRNSGRLVSARVYVRTGDGPGATSRFRSRRPRACAPAPDGCAVAQARSSPPKRCVKSEDARRGAWGPAARPASPKPRARRRPRPVLGRLVGSSKRRWLMSVRPARGLAGGRLRAWWREAVGVRRGHGSHTWLALRSRTPRAERSRGRE
jgi:hypothetical protein